MRSTSLLQTIILIFLIAISSNSQDCSGTNSSVCNSIQCPGYSMIGGICTQLCTSSNYFDNFTSLCKPCSSLTQPDCVSKCPNHFFNGSSLPNSTYFTNCILCSSRFGRYCTSCTQSTCSTCSPGKAVTDNKLGCRDNICNIENCLICAGTSACSQCNTGYKYNSTTIVCEVMSCSIEGCAICSNATCANCLQGYAYKNGFCIPICDRYCSVCTAPNYCELCNLGYAYDSAIQACKLDCSIGFGGNCAQCQSLLYCTKCKDGYVPIYLGAACVLNTTCTNPNCLSCPINTTNCLQCKTGYKLQNGSCIQDICSIANCISCKTVSTCNQCITNYAPDPTNGKTCIAACLSVIANCLICENNTSCQYCSPGFKASNSTSCVKACTNKGCDVCATEFTCKTCYNEYYLAGGDCILNCNDFGCATCQTTTSCSLCYAGYELNNASKCIRSCSQGSAKVAGGTCKKCTTYIARCQSCYPNYDDGYKTVLCNYCSSGYFLNYGVCTQCSTTLANCLQCSSNLVCTRCAADFRLNNNVCQSKDKCKAKNCKTCLTDNPDKCSVCNTGFTTNDNGLCKANTCATGMILSSGLCICPLGSYQSTSVNCQKCVDNNCLACSSISCSKCRSGYYASGVNCIACINNCQECIDGSSCTTCVPPYTYQSNRCTLKGDGSSVAIDANGTVFTCQAGCQSCKMGDNILVCITVQSGYALASGVIIKCGLTCKTCRDIPTSCLSCFKGYALNGDQCTTCLDPQALTCSADDAAYSLSCSRGYTLVVNTAVVPPTSVCTVCAANCFKCDINGAGKCDAGQCQTGYVQQTGQTRCTLCFNQCPRCSPDDLGICLECVSARFKNITGLCVSCPPGCKRCTSAICTDCFPGFLLSDSLCVEGPSWPCVEGTAANCTKCVANYALGGGVCTYAATCNSDSSCTSCSLGYYLSGNTTGKCNKCPTIANCLSCNTVDITKCLLCQNGYYAESTGTCSQCAAECGRCTSLHYCSRAVDGYYLTADPDGTYNGGVQKCNSPCATCISDPNFCLSCIKGYSIDGSSCFSDKQITYQMTFNYPSIFNNDDSYEIAYGKILLKFLQFRASICQNLPKAITKNDPFCQRNFNTKKFSRGSIKMQMSIAADSFQSSAAAQQAIDSANLVPSDLIVSKSASISGFQTQSSDSSTRNIGLILGVSIPLIILIVAIFTMMVYSNREVDNEFQGDAYETNKDIGDQEGFDEAVEKYV